MMIKEFYPCNIDSLASYKRQEPLLIMPGTYNPLHKGHLNIMNHAELYVGRPVILEHSIKRIEKNNSEINDIINVVAQAWGINRSILITSAPMFWQKAFLFPKSTFVIGVDTYMRILDISYYKDMNDPAACINLDLQIIRDNKCEFLVYPRIIDGKIVKMSDFKTEFDVRNFTDMSDRFILEKYPFTPDDISSTKLRDSVKS